MRRAGVYLPVNHIPFLQRLSETRPAIYVDNNGAVNLEWIADDWRLLISLEPTDEPFWCLVSKPEGAMESGRARVEGERPLAPIEVAG